MSTYEEIPRIFFVFLLLLFIPYICSLALIATAYNALVLHADDIFRTLIGALLVGLSYTL